MSRSAKGMLLGLLCTLIWGWQYTIGRCIFGESTNAADPYFLNMVKFFAGALALAPFLASDQRSRRLRDASGKDLLALSGLGLFGLMAEGFLALASAQYTTAARSTLLCNLSPIFTVLLAALALRKWPDRRNWLGVLLGLAGLALILATQSADSYDAKPNTLPGDLMALGSGMAWAFYTVYGGKYARRFGGITCTACMLTLAGCCMAVVCLCRGTDFTPDLGWKAWAGTLFLGIAASGLGLGLWSIALTMTDPAALGTYGYLSALISLGLSHIFTKEHLTWKFLVAFLLIMGAIYLMNKKESENPKDTTT